MTEITEEELQFIEWLADMREEDAMQLANKIKPTFDARWQRIVDCVELRQPDRMPVALYAAFWAAKYRGISCQQLMYD